MKVLPTLHSYADFEIVDTATNRIYGVQFYWFSEKKVFDIGVIR